MLIARVLGNATATVKHESLTGHKMLLVQSYLSDRVTPDGDPLLAIDGIGAGVGDEVMLTSDGRGARELLGHDATPVRWTIVGIND